MTVLEYDVPSEDTSYPVGAVTVISFVNPDPETLKLCALDAVPAQVVKLFKVPVVIMVAPSVFAEILRG